MGDLEPGRAPATPVQLRAITWTGAVLLGVGLLVLLLPAMGAHVYTSSGEHSAGIGPTGVVIAVIVAALGVLLIAVRVAAGGVLAAVRSEAERPRDRPAVID